MDSQPRCPPTLTSPCCCPLPNRSRNRLWRYGRLVLLGPVGLGKEGTLSGIAGRREHGTLSSSSRRRCPEPARRCPGSVGSTARDFRNSKARTARGYPAMTGSTRRWAAPPGRPSAGNRSHAQLSPGSADAEQRKGAPPIGGLLATPKIHIELGGEVSPSDPRQGRPAPGPRVWRIVAPSPEVGKLSRRLAGRRTVAGRCCWSGRRCKTRS